MVHVRWRGWHLPRASSGLLALVLGRVLERAAGDGGEGWCKRGMGGREGDRLVVCLGADRWRMAWWFSFAFSERRECDWGWEECLVLAFRGVLLSGSLFGKYQLRIVNQEIGNGGLCVVRACRFSKKRIGKWERPKLTSRNSRDRQHERVKFARLVFYWLNFQNENNACEINSFL